MEPVRRILSEAEERKIVLAIEESERRTSGEIRVHIEERTGGDALGAARRWFHRLGMDRTALRNGVLIYLAVHDRAFAIVGDQGIHEKVGEACWNSLRDQLQAAFTQGEFVVGLEGAVRSVGSLLSEHFPPGGGDRNELPNEVSR